MLLIEREKGLGREGKGRGGRREKKGTRGRREGSDA